MELSLIIIEYHCMAQVRECVSSINQYLSDVHIECLIVSNSEYSISQMDSFQRDNPDLNIINTRDNLGYAGGVNVGLSIAKGRYIYVVNPDCLLTDAGVIDIIRVMDGDDKWAIAGPVVIDENNNVQPSCRRFPKPWTFLLARSIFSRLPGAVHEIKRYFMADFDRKSIRDVDWVSGGATLVKASALENIGGMDERYFLYMEDVDWCRSAWEKGYKVKYCPLSTVIHAGQHQSIKFSLGLFKNVHFRWHLNSLWRYFVKYSFKTYPQSSSYLKSS